MKIPHPPPNKSGEELDRLEVAERQIKELEKKLAVKEEEVIILRRAGRFFLGQLKKGTLS